MKEQDRIVGYIPPPKIGTEHRGITGRENGVYQYSMSVVVKAMRVKRRKALRPLYRIELADGMHFFHLV